MTTDPSPDAGRPAADLPSGPAAETPAAVRPEWQAQVDTVLKVVGIVTIVLLAAMTALYEVFYSPLRSGTTRIPLSLVLAVVLNPLLAIAASWVTGRRLAALLPGLAWCVVFFMGASKTREGDLLLTDNNWVGLVTLLAGPVAFAVAVFVPVMREQRRAVQESAPAAPVVATTPSRPPAPGSRPSAPGSRAPAPGSKPKKGAGALRQPAKKR